MADSFEPLILIVSGPSGSGKSTLVKKLLELPGTMLSISATTRPPRANESDGKWYHFVSDQEFRQMIERGEFLEHACVFGKHSYGTPKKSLEEARARQLDLVLEIDVQGAEQVRQKLPESVAIFIVPPSRRELEKRIRARNQDREDEIARRLDQARLEMARYLDYDYVVINEDVDRAGEAVRAIAQSARCETKRNRLRVHQILKSFGG
ncbi:MAG TPA: guanylate kinase [Candidatus Acidoferrales bacterium]|nr:guanylate kinase [Candidatus Acidoferrales bacterium]